MRTRTLFAACATAVIAAAAIAFLLHYERPSSNTKDASSQSNGSLQKTHVAQKSDGSLPTAPNSEFEEQSRNHHLKQLIQAARDSSLESLDRAFNEFVGDPALTQPQKARLLWDFYLQHRANSQISRYALEAMRTVISPQFAELPIRALADTSTSNSDRVHLLRLIEHINAQLQDTQSTTSLSATEKQTIQTALAASAQSQLGNADPNIVREATILLSRALPTTQALPMINTAKERSALHSEDYARELLIQIYSTQEPKKQELAMSELLKTAAQNPESHSAVRRLMLFGMHSAVPRLSNNVKSRAFDFLAGEEPSVMTPDRQFSMTHAVEYVNWKALTAELKGHGGSGFVSYVVSELSTKPDAGHIVAFVLSPYGSEVLAQAKQAGKLDVFARSVREASNQLATSNPSQPLFSDTLQLLQQK